MSQLPLLPITQTQELEPKSMTIRLMKTLFQLRPMDWMAVSTEHHGAEGVELVLGDPFRVAPGCLKGEAEAELGVS